MNHPSGESINFPDKRSVFPKKSAILPEDQYVSIETGAALLKNKNLPVSMN
jgi:hypothetical protein